MVDALASEYGWSIEYIMGVPCDVTAQLFHALLHRKGVVTRRANPLINQNEGSLHERLQGIFGQIDTHD